jgi:hypothetical protein
MKQFLKAAVMLAGIVAGSSPVQAWCPGYNPNNGTLKDARGVFWTPEPFVVYNNPAANNATFASTHKTLLAKDELVIGLEANGRTWCFPLRLMAIHRIANVDVGEEVMTVTYSPISNSAVVYRPNFIDGSGIRKGKTLLEYGGDYGGGMVIDVILSVPPRGSNKFSSHSQLNPAMVNPANPTGRSLKLGPPVLVTSYEAWRNRHPSTAVMQPDPEAGPNKYDAYDLKPEGYTKDPLRDRTILAMDPRLARETEVFGVALGGDAAAFTLDELRRLGGVATTLQGEVVTVLWDNELRTPYVLYPPEGLIATRSYWDAWSSLYPRVPLNDTGIRSSITDWATH